MRFSNYFLIFALFVSSASFGQEILLHSYSNVAIKVNGAFATRNGGYVIHYSDFYMDSFGLRKSKTKLLELDESYNITEGLDLGTNEADGDIGFRGSNCLLRGDRILNVKCSVSPVEDNVLKFSIHAFDLVQKTETLLKEGQIIWDYPISQDVECVLIGSRDSPFLLVNFILLGNGKAKQTSFVFNPEDNNLMQLPKYVNNASSPLDSSLIVIDGKIRKYFPFDDQYEPIVSKNVLTGIYSRSTFSNVTDDKFFVGGYLPGPSIWAGIYNANTEYTDTIIIKSVGIDRCYANAFLYSEFEPVQGKYLVAYSVLDPRICEQPPILGFLGYLDSPPNEYGVLVLDEWLNICDTLKFVADQYRIIYQQFVFEGGGMALTGQVYDEEFNSIRKAFVHFIRLDSICGLNKIDNYYEKSYAKIYPNPTKDNVNIEVSEAGKFHVIVYDILGKQQIGLNLALPENISTKKLTPGLYILELWKDGRLKAREKLIKSSD